MKNLMRGLVFVLLVAPLSSCKKLDALLEERQRLHAEITQLEGQGRALDATLRQMKITDPSSSGLYGLTQYEKQVEAEVAVLRAKLTEAEVRTQSLELEVNQLQGEADFFRPLLPGN